MAIISSSECYCSHSLIYIQNDLLCHNFSYNKYTTSICYFLSFFVVFDLNITISPHYFVLFAMLLFISADISKNFNQLLIIECLLFG